MNQNPELRRPLERAVCTLDDISDQIIRSKRGLRSPAFIAVIGISTVAGIIDSTDNLLQKLTSPKNAR